MGVDKYILGSHLAWLFATTPEKVLENMRISINSAPGARALFLLSQESVQGTLQTVGGFGKSHKSAGHLVSPFFNYL
jgi:hypothetical protein